ncbi:hypothetical protein KC325_g221 [Hortaea werneckii]|nr:hypothetical protein KC325_g221 [Hortaea werneckii]
MRRLLLQLIDSPSARHKVATATLAVFPVPRLTIIHIHRVLKVGVAVAGKVAHTAWLDAHRLDVIPLELSYGS